MCFYPCILYIFACLFVFQVLCNGPGTCVPLCAAGLLLGILGLKRVLIVYVESICRVETLSLSGKILYYFSDYFFVQWAPLKDKYPKAICLGRLVWSLSVDFFTFVLRISLHVDTVLHIWFIHMQLLMCWIHNYDNYLWDLFFFKPNNLDRLIRCPVLPFTPLKSQQN